MAWISSETGHLHALIIISGGSSLENQLGGFYFEPTVMTQVTPNMRVWQEEVFGPVLPMDAPVLKNFINLLRVLKDCRGKNASIKSH